MRHRKKEIKISSRYGHRRSELKNLASSLLLYEKIETTQAKAKLLRPYVEKIVTLGKKDTLASRRSALKKLSGKNAVKKLFAVFGPRYRDRAGGYTRVYRSRTRPGDRAILAQISML